MNKLPSAGTFGLDAAARGPIHPDHQRQYIRIGRNYRFEAAHYLPLVPEGHRCRKLHGHNYRIEITVRGRLDTRGFVCDFAEIDTLIEPLLRRVDHQLLNEVEGLENPTAEMIAAWFLKGIPDCERVRVYENDDCWAEVAR
jgi:6-pyruvoyltetrahydropterin/6-carboxytetrahydropterin synthase